jgi:outer membrane protein assembly factor BamD
MNRRMRVVGLAVACLALATLRSPAPLVYTPGEGWTYEPVGAEGKWRRARAKDQLEVAQQAFEQGDYGTAIKAARHLVRSWPLSDYAPEAQYLLGRCYEAKRYDEKAFKEYQKVLEKYPRSGKANEVLQRQYAIATRFLKGQWFKLWGYIPAFPSMERTATMFQNIVKAGPYSDVAPHAQLRLGAAREKQRHYTDAVKAYETAADRYYDRSEIAADAIYRAGMAWYQQARTAEYDQSAAGRAIAQLTDFVTLFPGDARVAEAQKIIASLKAEQARGYFATARFYEKRKKWNGALVYYNEVVLADPTSPLAEEARKRIEQLKQRRETAG